MRADAAFQLKPLDWNQGQYLKAPKTRGDSSAMWVRCVACGATGRVLAEDLVTVGAGECPHCEDWDVREVPGQFEQDRMSEEAKGR